MDVRLMEDEPTRKERFAVDGLLGPPASGWVGAERSALDGHLAYAGRSAREQRHLLLPALQAVQSEIGWISAGALNYVCQRLTVPPAEAYGVASFYALLSTSERPPRVVHVCDDLACVQVGAAELMDQVEAGIGPAGEPGGDGSVTWERSPCLGRCESAPAVFLQRAADPDLSIAPAHPGSIIKGLGGVLDAQSSVFTSQSIPQFGHPGLRLLRRVGHVDPESLDDYRAAGGYSALRRALGLGPSGVIQEIKESRLLGRGGAAFPAGIKWEAVATAASTPRYVICNADESEPGTFKDRVLMEHDPSAVLEAMTIAGYAVGAERGFIYIRGEYPVAAERLQGAADQARSRGFLGEDVMGAGFAFDVELRRGAGAYICGEETALMNSIEGYRGEPRNKPPFPTQAGLFGKPTLVNNVETLANVLDIVLEGGSVFASVGTAESTGPKLFCLSGSVARPGVYEVPFGATTRDLLDLAGGVREGRELQAVLLGGAAGGFLAPDQLDVPLTFEDTRAIGAALGSGAVIVFDDGIDLREVLERIARFFRDESCGQCVPCRVGTVRQEEALTRIRVGNGSTWNSERPLLDDLAVAMGDASICGLGQTAAAAIQSALRLELVGGKR